ncbi:MAG: bifunctional UDP-3-O-[3-hydroxymyristoyl] N-acetylglucosamine deacetylase/3-hydroxyacyl-ACP dehydratase [Candidatus Eisenbacteria bacterium]|uniref:Multifunctional fusion protein n=1 Tax=Eiseniibacteriota bacterium TaxID=2212470 RepID=A0A956M1C7_UNCEI|nr:bifunctional UDP-3-O-[3-hydroxymyristoyl] N-acetylglucosamine deacetylase/3-hydroxyacyl-ACP dehydratase [Candidatus Eisenbacteria bacterium]
MNPTLQHTIAKEVSFSGVGLHTGCRSTIRFKPAAPDSGLTFVRTDLAGAPSVRVAPENAREDVGPLRRTILRVGEAEVHTVEHILGTLSGLGIDNALMEIDALEVPEPADGSARAFLDVLREAGLVEQDLPRRFLEVEVPVSFEDGPIKVVALPHDGFQVSFTIQFDNPLVGTQHINLEINPETFASEIASARTFALYEDVEKLRAAGMIQGGTLSNAVVVKGDTILNEDGLRFADEFVRHKVLDLMGDLTLLGRPLRGHVLSVRSGHSANVRFVKKLHQAMNGSEYFDALLDRVHYDIGAISRIMPHRYPLLLVDRILYLEERKRVVGLKNVTINEPFFVGHFPGHPIMPAVLIVEAMAQCGGVLLLNTVDDPDNKLVYFMGIDNAKFRRPVLPGDQLIMDLELVRLKTRICRMNARGYVRGQLVAEAELSSTIVDR